MSADKIVDEHPAIAWQVVFRQNLYPQLPLMLLMIFWVDPTTTE
jgi:hypothetical protein